MDKSLQSKHKINYLDQLLTISQDRRNKSAIDIWGKIMHAQRSFHHYPSIEGQKIIGITAKDMSFQLNMTLSSVYHNLKILQKQEYPLLEEENFSTFNKEGRRVSQKVYRIPNTFFLEYNQLVTSFRKDKSYLTHRAILLFNLLQIKGVIEYFSALLGSGRLLIDENLHEISDWYQDWMKSLDIKKNQIFPGSSYSITPKIAKEIINLLTMNLSQTSLDQSLDYEPNEKNNKDLHTFTFFLWPPPTREMNSGDWMTQQELIVCKENIPSDCTIDHPTFFKYEMECPICGAKKSIKEKIEKRLKNQNT